MPKQFVTHFKSRWELRHDNCKFSQSLVSLKIGNDPPETIVVSWIAAYLQNLYCLFYAYPFKVSK